MRAVIKAEDVYHSKRGASSATRWMNCPGSIGLYERAAEKYGVKDQSSMAADEGTAAHTVLAGCLENDCDAWEYVGTTIEVGQSKIDVTPEMADAVQVCVDLVRQKLDQHKDKNPTLHVERGMESLLNPDLYGTSDVVIEVPQDRIIVIDYKHGIGITVEPTTEQLSYYGYLACEYSLIQRPELRDLVVELWISQPRIAHPKGQNRLHVSSEPILTDWFTQTVVPAAQETYDPNAPLNVGSWCQFCPAKMFCPAIKGETVELEKRDSVEVLTDSELTDIMNKASSIRRFLDEVERTAFERAMNGHVLDGFKLVNKRGDRIWKEGAEKAVKEVLGEDAYTAPKLKSPAQIEKLTGGKDLVTTYCYKPQTGLTLAPASDKRPPARRPMEAFLDSEGL